MRIEVTGVLEDGTPRRAGVPINPRTTLSVPRGVDLELVVTVVTPLGAAVNLEDGSTSVVFTLKRRSQEEARITKTAAKSGNRATFLITPAELKRLQPGLFSWDVLLTKGGLRDAVIPLSPFKLQASNAAIP